MPVEPTGHTGWYLDNIPTDVLQAELTRRNNERFQLSEAVRRLKDGTGYTGHDVLSRPDVLEAVVRASERKLHKEAMSLRGQLDELERRKAKLYEDKNLVEQHCRGELNEQPWVSQGGVIDAGGDR